MKNIRKTNFFLAFSWRVNYIDGIFIVNAWKINYIYGVFIENMRKIEVWKRLGLLVEGLLVGKISEGASGNLPFFVSGVIYKKFSFQS